MNNWFGKTKSRFSIVPLLEVARLGTGHTPSREKEEYWVNCDIPWVTVEDIRKHGLFNFKPLEETTQHISKLGLDNSAAVLHPAGTVMLSRTASIGLSCITGKDMATTQAFVTWTANQQKLEPRYLHAALKVLTEQYEFLAYGATHLTIYFPDIKTLKIPLPSLREQILIADFLEEETSKINDLIQQQEKLIELLNENRKSIITNAVSGRLDKNIKMRDTGILWLPEIPEHWEIKKIKQISYLKGRVGWKGLSSDEYLETGYAHLVTGTDFKQKFIDWKNCHCIDKERYEDDPFIQLQEDDLLITKDGTIGKLAIVKNLSGPACLNSGIFLLRPRNSYTTDFMYWVLSSDIFKLFCDLSSMGSTIQHLYQNVFEKFTMGLPSIEEQKHIVQYIEDKTLTIDNLISKAEESIRLLKERLVSLISSAVVGEATVYKENQ